MTKAISRRQYLTGKVIAIFLPDGTILLAMYLLAHRLTRLSVQVSFFEGIIKMIPIIMLGFYQPSKKLGYVLPPIQQLIKGSFTKSLADLKVELVLACLYVAVLGVVDGLIFSNKELDY